ncbi:hypothetical protein [Mycobacteroides abscessus]|uniref:hypothetical protein n=1 Tax=Mycobacteroides abscessus TaxID=36809 RepID=UPI000C25C354|nr:hypothetical protein [Mycobacteroides abscessus]
MNQHSVELVALTNEFHTVTDPAVKRELGITIENMAARIVYDWMAARDIEEIRVDDENRTPSFARDYDDQDLDHAISWLPATVITNFTEPAWNPVVCRDVLTQHLNSS